MVSRCNSKNKKFYLIAADFEICYEGMPELVINFHEKQAHGLWKSSALTVSSRNFDIPCVCVDYEITPYNCKPEERIT